MCRPLEKQNQLSQDEFLAQEGSLSHNLSQHLHRGNFLRREWSRRHRLGSVCVTGQSTLELIVQSLQNTICEVQDQTLRMTRRKLFENTGVKRDAMPSSLSRAAQHNVFDEIGSKLRFV